MTKKKLTGNEMFKMVKEECERSLGKVENATVVKEKGVLYYGKRNGESGWYKNGDEKNDSKYVGEIKNDVPNGKGTDNYPDGRKYVGEFKDGWYHGHGTFTYKDGSKYVGEYNDGKRHGQGTETWSDGTKYLGEWKNGKRHGQGTYIFSSGSKYVGAFKNDKRDGQGTLTLKDGLKYEGTFRDGNMDGQGTETWSDGRKYKGGYRDDKEHGQGIETYADGRKYVGSFKDGKRDGQGTFTFPNGKKYVGEFKNSKPWNGKEYDKNEFITAEVVNGKYTKVNGENIETRQQISKSVECPRTRTLGVIFPPTVMGNVSDSRKQILLNTLDEEISKCFDVSPPTNASSGDLPEVENIFQLQIVEEDGDTQLSLRWTSGKARKVETIFCSGCGTNELNVKLVGLVSKSVEQMIEPVLSNNPPVKVKKKPVVKEKGYVSSIDPENVSSLYLSGINNFKRKDCMEVTMLLPANDRLNYLKVCGVILENKKEQQSNKPDKIWIDPRSKLRLNLSEMGRKREKKECMEVAKLLPTDGRLKLLRGCGLID
jgi:hypothetical protein